MMNAILPGTLAILCYLASALRQSQTLMGRKEPARALVLILGLIALINHLFSLIALIMVSDGLSLGIFNVVSLVFAVVAGLAIFKSTYMPLENLFVFLFPTAALAEFAALIFPPAPVPHAALGGGVLTHALLSVLAYSIFIIAFGQALLLWVQDRALNKKHVSGIVRVLPPLVTMESLLFQLLWTGFIFLTLSITSGFIFLEDLFAQRVAHKTVFSLLSWMVFAVLLIGRHQLGWRGNKALRWIFGGCGLLLLGYFGSKFVVELVLHS